MTILKELPCVYGTQHDVLSQDCQGSTPLHRAIVNHQLQTMIALLNAGADPTIPNHSLHNCMHRAAALGFLA